MDDWVTEQRKIRKEELLRTVQMCRDLKEEVALNNFQAKEILEELICRLQFKIESL